MTKRRYPMILILLASLLMAHCSGTEEEKHDQDTSNNQDILNNEVTAKMEVTDMSSEEDMTTSQEESNEIVLVDMKGEQTGEEVMQEDSIQVDFLHEDSEHSDSMTEESKVEEMITAETIEEMIIPEYMSAESGGITFSWLIDGDDIKIKVAAPTTGWVAAGLKPSKGMLDANMLIGYVKGDVVTIRDDFAINAFSHKSDISLGGEDNIADADGSEEAGVTTISFTIPLNSGDSFDQTLTAGEKITVILAYGPNGEDNFTKKHAGVGVVEISL